MKIGCNIDVAMWIDNLTIISLLRDVTRILMDIDDLFYVHTCYRMTYPFCGILVDAFIK